MYKENTYFRDIICYKLCKKYYNIYSKDNLIVFFIDDQGDDFYGRYENFK